MSAQYLIIGGTEKSGTTSLYRYLNDHPSVTGSFKKETDFFRKQEAPPSSLQLADYHARFPSPAGVRMEASPGYLVDSAYAAPAIKALIPSARLLFVLRDPIERLVSSFEFHKSRLYLPAELPFDAYVERCFAYERGELTPEAAGMGEWFLRVPDAGRYAAHLRDFYAHFPAEQIKVLPLELLNGDPAAFMQTVCAWAGLDAGFYAGYEFTRANVTFAPKAAGLQRVALLANRRLEPFFNRFPGVKQRLLAVYKAVNGMPAAKPVVGPETRARLAAYYRDDVAALIAMTDPAMEPARGWLQERHGR
jgi:hypothetical protein